MPHFLRHLEPIGIRLNEILAGSGKRQGPVVWASVLLVPVGVTGLDGIAHVVQPNAHLEQVDVGIDGIALVNLIQWAACHLLPAKVAAHLNGVVGDESPFERRVEGWDDRVGVTNLLKILPGVRLSPPTPDHEQQDQENGEAPHVQTL